MTGSKRRSINIDEINNGGDDNLVVKRVKKMPDLSAYSLPRMPNSNLSIYQTDDELFDSFYSTKLVKEMGLDMNLVRAGHDDTLKVFETGHGNLTQAQYDLILEDSLSEDSLYEHSGGKVTKRNKGIRLLVIQSRFEKRTVDDGGEGKVIIFDKKKDKEFLQPKYIFDALLQTHLINGHLKADKMHNLLQEKYANVIRDISRRSIQFCSVCNQNLEVKPFTRPTQVVFSKKFHLLPFERVQMELFKPFNKSHVGTRIIEGKYPYILFLKDYYSKYTWIYPLENVTVGDILPHLKQFLMSTVINVPMFLESCTIGPDMMKNLVEYMCSEYGLKVGCGLGRAASFQKSGIRIIKKFLKEKTEECLKDWGHVLSIVYKYNNEYLSNIREIPRRMVLISLKDAKEFEKKKEAMLDALPATCFKRYYGQAGFFYVEPESSKFGYDDKEEEFFFNGGNDGEEDGGVSSADKENTSTSV